MQARGPAGGIKQVLHGWTRSMERATHHTGESRGLGVGRDGPSPGGSRDRPPSQEGKQMV